MFLWLESIFEIEESMPIIEFKLQWWFLARENICSETTFYGSNLFKSVMLWWSLVLNLHAFLSTWLFTDKIAIFYGLSMQ